MATLSKPSTPYRTEGTPAPGKLVVVQGFLNSWSAELDIEDFDKPATTEQWLRSAGLWDANKKVTNQDWRRILDMRDRIRRGVLDPSSMAALQDPRPALVFHMTFERETTPSLEPTGDACDKVLGRLLAIIYDSMIDGSWARFKCCALDSCGWAFYDATRSRTKRWCSMRTCGSRHKAREYYRRQR